MKPLREDRSPLGSLLESAASLEPEADEVVLARARARFFSARRERSPLTMMAAFCAAGLVGAVLVFAVMRLSASGLEPHAETPGASWSWVGRVGDSSHRGEQELVLGTGALEATATQPLTISTPNASFLTSSARFRVLVAGDGLTSLTVEEGAVVVRVAGKADQRIDAPGHWDSGPDADSAEASFHRWALELERDGRSDDALVVLEALSGSSSVWAELALYDAARICVDRHEPARARRFIETFERRYATGLLLREMKALQEKLERGSEK